MSNKPHKISEKEGTLLIKTRELVKNDTRSLPDLATESGIPFYWLQKLNTFKSPSVNRIQYLYEFLSNKKLSV